MDFHRKTVKYSYVFKFFSVVECLKNVAQRNSKDDDICEKNVLLECLYQFKIQVKFWMKRIFLDIILDSNRHLYVSLSSGINKECPQVHYD